ncbi:MAG: ATP synthase F1 subunit gamma [Bdellovibrionota bacterium]
MAGLKTIRRRIVSVRNTKQITRAMKLVSAAKLRRAQDAALSGRKFSERLAQIFRVVLRELPDDFSHPLFTTRPEVKRRRVIFVSGERGLCGAYNANVTKAIQQNEASAPNFSERVDFFPIGKQAITACKRFGWTNAGPEERLSEDVADWPAAEIAQMLVDDYIEGKFDELVVYYTKFVSAMTQEVTREVLLPFSTDALSEAAEDGVAADHTEYGSPRFDPSPDQILLKLVTVLLASKLRQAGLEAKASEHAARMTAMDSATRNADDLIGQLRLFYNRARQSAITRELIDIVGGAEAIK